MRAVSLPFISRIKFWHYLQSHRVDASLQEMLKKSGKMYFYKSIQLDDMEQFKKKKITDVSQPALGTRNIISTWK